MVLKTQFLGLLNILEKSWKFEVSTFYRICNFRQILYITFFIERVKKYNEKGYVKNLPNVKLKPLKWVEKNELFAICSSDTGIASYTQVHRMVRELLANQPRIWMDVNANLRCAICERFA